MNKELTNTEFGILAALSIVVLVTILFIPIQMWTQRLYGENLILEMLVAVLIVVQLASLYFQVKEE